MYEALFFFPSLGQRSKEAKKKNNNAWSQVTRLMAREITYNNFEVSLVVFMPNITTNNAITYTNSFKLSLIKSKCL